MQAAAVIAQIENLQRETFALLESLNIDGKPQEKLVEKLDSLYASIEQLESQLDGAHIPQLTDGQIRHHIKSKEMKLGRLITHLKRLLVGNVEVGGHSAPVLLSTLISSSMRTESVLLSNLVHCVAVAERPDFSPIQLIRRFKFEKVQDGHVSASAITSLLSISNSYPSSEQLCTARLQCEEDQILCDDEQLQVPTESAYTPIGLCLLYLGFMNKLEQQFSPTSIINNVARM